MRDDAVLASDAERGDVVDMLQQAHVEGRLTQAELAERIGAALAARTRGELARLIEDLPGSGPAGVPAVYGAVPVPEPVGPALPERSELRAAWTAWAIASSVTFVVWGITAIAATQWVFPWFLWVAGPWGAVLLVKTLTQRGRNG
jgi:hypothetical protein